MLQNKQHLKIWVIAITDLFIYTNALAEQLFRNLCLILSGKQTEKMLSIRQFKLNANEAMKALYY